MGKKEKDKKKKKWKDEEEEARDQSGKSPAGTYADGHPLHQIQYLEAKLILKPDRFTSVENFREFGKLVKKTAKKKKWIGPWRRSIQQGLAPVSIGLLLAGCFTMAKGAIFGLETATIAVVVLLLLLNYKINPALLILAGAVIGVFSFTP